MPRTPSSERPAVPAGATGTTRRRTRVTAVLAAPLAALVVAVLLQPMGVAAQAAEATLTAAAATVPPPGRAATGIEPMASYVADASCDVSTKPGTNQLAAALKATWPGTTAGTARECGTDGSISEHYDGRAVDWMTSVRTADGAARANAFIAWLFATDAHGNTFAQARRLGVMYLIWNNKIWGAYRPTDGWRPYSSCASHPEAGWDTACHRDHIHISLSWEGAMGRTSYWSGAAAATDYGPCRVPDLTWAPPYAAARSTPCPTYPPVPVPAGASSLLVRLITASGALLHPGSVGSPVGAVNELLGLGTGTSWTASTTAALRAYQAARQLPQSGVMDVATWRAATGSGLVAASTPKGHLDGVAAGRASLTATGWGFDGENDATLSVRVSVDGAATTAAANLYRADVARAFPAHGSYHGFSVTRAVVPGVHRVCVDLLNAGLGHDVALGCVSVTVSVVLVPVRSHHKVAVRMRVAA